MPSRRMKASAARCRNRRQWACWPSAAPDCWHEGEGRPSANKDKSGELLHPSPGLVGYPNDEAGLFSMAAVVFGSAELLHSVLFDPGNGVAGWVVRWRKLRKNHGIEGS